MRFSPICDVRGVKVRSPGWDAPTHRPAAWAELWLTSHSRRVMAAWHVGQIRRRSNGKQYAFESHAGANRYIITATHHYWQWQLWTHKWRLGWNSELTSQSYARMSGFCENISKCGFYSTWVYLTVIASTHLSNSFPSVGNSIDLNDLPLHPITPFQHVASLSWAHDAQCKLETSLKND